MYKKRGFTLVELLVVISIIAVLMAILMPVLRRVKGQAKQVMCANNMHQIGVAASLYSQAWDNYIPRGEYDAEHTTWFMLFLPYLSVKPIDGDYRNVKIYRCPSYPDKEQTVCFVSNAWNPANDGQSGSSTKTQITWPTQLTSYRRPGSTIYLTDNDDGPYRDIITAEYDYPGSEGWDWTDVHQVKHLPRLTDEEHKKAANTSRGDCPRVAPKRHGNGSNCLFADWHVEHKKRNELADKTPEGVLNTVGIDLWRFKTR